VAGSVYFVASKVFPATETMIDRPIIDNEDEVEQRRSIDDGSYEQDHGEKADKGGAETKIRSVSELA